MVHSIVFTQAVVYYDAFLFKIDAGTVPVDIGFIDRQEKTVPVCFTALSLREVQSFGSSLATGTKLTSAMQHHLTAVKRSSSLRHEFAVLHQASRNRTLDAKKELSPRTLRLSAAAHHLGTK